MHFSALTGYRVTSGRNLLFKYIKQELYRMLTLCFSSSEFVTDFFCFDVEKASHLYWSAQAWLIHVLSLSFLISKPTS